MMQIAYFDLIIPWTKFYPNKKKKQNLKSVLKEVLFMDLKKRVLQDYVVQIWIFAFLLAGFFSEIFVSLQNSVGKYVFNKHMNAIMFFSALFFG